MLIDTTALSIVDECSSAEGTVFRYELKAGLAAYFARLGPAAPVKSLADVIAFNQQHRDQEMPYFGQDFFESSVEKGPLTEFEYLEALARCRRFARTEGIDAVLDKLGLDALVAPTMGPACSTDLVNGDHWLGGSTTPAAVAGYPSVTVPAGFVHGLPVGLSFIGRAWSEPTAQARVRLRADHEPPPAAAIPQNGRREWMRCIVKPPGRSNIAPTNVEAPPEQPPLAIVRGDLLSPAARALIDRSTPSCRTATLNRAPTTFAWRRTRWPAAAARFSSPLFAASRSAAAPSVGLDSATGEIKRMYVLPAARGRGVARRVLEALEVEAQALGLRRLGSGNRRPAGRGDRALSPRRVR